jgi:NADH-quinone oxidoreductase subunit C
MNETRLHARLACAGIPGIGALDTSTRDPFVVVEAAAVVDVLLFLRDDAECAMDMLQLVTATERADRIELAYHVCSYTRHQSLTVKVHLPRPDGAGLEWTPSVPSVAAVYPSAEWHEREQYDLLGVQFAGHPDLRRILLPEEWIGHPLRKAYVYPSHAGDIPLELDATPIYERVEGRSDPVRPPREPGAPLVQPPSAPSTRPHAGGKAPPPKAKDESPGGGHGAAKRKAHGAPPGGSPAEPKAGDGQGTKQAGGQSGAKGGDDMAARIAAIKAAKAKKDKEGGS